jgi:SNF family Na+-dependent transporter
VQIQVVTACCSYTHRHSSNPIDGSVISLDRDVWPCCRLQGFVVFSILGYVAEQEGGQVADVATGGSGLAFVVFPTALAKLPAPNFFSVLFFVMLLSLGLSSSLALVAVRPPMQSFRGRLTVGAVHCARVRLTPLGGGRCLLDVCSR